MNTGKQMYCGPKQVQAIALGGLVVAIGLTALLQTPQRLMRQERARLYDMATNTLSTNAIPGLLLLGNSQKAMEVHEDMWRDIYENQRDTTAPRIFSERELADFETRFGAWGNFSSKYRNKESDELETLAREHVYNLHKQSK